MLAAWLLSLVVGMALFESLAAEHSAPPDAAQHRLAPHKDLSTLPLAAQGAVSAAVGADSPAYRVTASGAGFEAQNAAQRLHMRFGSPGVQIRSGNTQIGLSLGAVGYGTSLQAVGAVAPTPKANRVTYARSGLSEWYVNGPLGLEQGFTIPRAPSGHPAGALTLSMALSGNAHASLGSGGQSITLSRTGGPVLRYSGLRATDARGRVLHSWLALHAGRLLLRVDARNAHYPLRIDPFVQQGGKLTGSGESGEGLLGYSVALSSNGNTALVGAPHDKPGTNFGVGAAWVFTRKEGTWTQQQELKGSGEVGEGEFGYSVALGEEGNTALVGGPLDNGEVGAAWVFTRTGSTWTQQQELKGTGEIGKGEFGYSVALASTGGNTALIGGRGDNSMVGAAWVFTRSVAIWTQQQELTGTGEVEKGEFGGSAALSSDGKTALIGGHGDSAFVGAAWVFTFSGSTWTQQQELKGAGESGAGLFGYSVALSPEGNTALIGAPGDSLGVGAAWLFTRSSEKWTQQQELKGAGEVEKGEFGNGVGLSAEGNTALVGGPNDNTNVGAAWFFTRSGSTWTQQGEKRTGSGETSEGFFGYSAALSSEGATALIGGPGDNSKAGAAWVFVFQAPKPPTVVTKAASSETNTSATLNATVNPNGAEVSKCEFEYGETTAYGKTAPCTPSSLGQGESEVAVSASVTGLTANTTYDFRISATNPGGTSKGSNATFKTLANTGTPPTVVTGAASFKRTSATLNATVNPNGGLVHECKFEYGETTSYGSTAECTPSPGSGTSPVPVSASVTGLNANTTYHFRISATNPGGTSNGSDVPFTTQPFIAPTAVTATATSITQTSATLNATVNPNEGTVSECKFEYGTTIAYGSTASCSSLPGSGTSPVAVSASLTGLINKTTYHFRISATNPGGTGKGSDQTFTTGSPHWYTNGSIQPEGAILPTIAWGTLTLTNSTLGEVECHTVFAGYSENPTGGGTAVGKIQGFSAYECASASCTSSGGTAIVVKAEKLPWSTEVAEPKAGVFRLKIGNKTKAAGAAFLSVNCVGVKNVQFFGEHAPTILNNGSSIGSKPAQVQFDQPGSGELESEAAGGLKFEGKFKVEGYEEEELIGVKNP